MRIPPFRIEVRTYRLDRHQSPGLTCAHRGSGRVLLHPVVLIPVDAYGTEWTEIWHLSPIRSCCAERSDPDACEAFWFETGLQFNDIISIADADPDAWVLATHGVDIAEALETIVPRPYSPIDRPHSVERQGTRRTPRRRTHPRPLRRALPAPDPLNVPRRPNRRRRRGDTDEHEALHYNYRYTRGSRERSGTDVRRRTTRRPKSTTTAKRRDATPRSDTYHSPYPYGRYVTSYPLPAPPPPILPQLPPPPPSPASQPMTAEQAANVLGVTPTDGADRIREAHRQAALRAHPDHGGTDAAMAALNSARDVLVPHPATDNTSSKVR
jgi:hypothetical protein